MEGEWKVPYIMHKFLGARSKFLLVRLGIKLWFRVYSVQCRDLDLEFEGLGVRLLVCSGQW